jgi:bifunctional UDP-N-acetylglucosamine pyrophosphorylase/glucosamine-1-phosphate N-acetyltransferase
MSAISANGGNVERRPCAAVVLAAGKSTRMVTDLPKVLHEVCGRPMLAYVIDACREAGINRIVVVVGYRKDDVIAAFAGEPGLQFVEQAEQKGTGHAVQICRDALAGFEGNVVVIAGDMPLLRTETLTLLTETHDREHSAVTLATAILEEPTGYGRIVRDAYGNLQGIVEHADCTPEQLRIKEINPSYYCFDKKLLFEALENVRPNNVKGEYYLTDALHILIHRGCRAVAVTAVAAVDAMGVNSRQQLAEVGKIMQARIQDRFMNSGVTIVDPPNTWIDARARIGRDTVIHPFTYIHGRVQIGARCSIGPFAYIRDGTRLADDVVVGVFAELKNTALGEGTRVRHLTYIGDATIGERVNVGAGTIVANFDGTHIQATVVEKDAFIGSGSILVAPLKLPTGTHVCPGSVVTNDSSGNRNGNHR